MITKQHGDWMNFSQSVGLEPLPKRLQLGVLDERARNILHAVIHKTVIEAGSVNLLSENYRIIDNDFRDAVQEFFVSVLGRNLSSFDSFQTTLPSFFEKFFSKSPYNKTFDAIQFYCSHPSVSPKIRNYFILQYSKAFSDARIAYILDNTGYIVPIASSEEGAAIQEALLVTNASNLQGARKHLLEAGKFIDQGNWAGSIRESIHAVEAVACIIAGKPKATLSDALQKIEQVTPLHPAFKQGLDKIYAYTSDERGLRHSLTESDGANVSMAEAVFMFGACASFVTYLISKSGLNGVAVGS